LLAAYPSDDEAPTPGGLVAELETAREMARWAESRGTTRVAFEIAF
jgi:hypothetical protein